jgi:hypothetical protein
MVKRGMIYLGVWFQRTALHLKEVYRFLDKAEGIPGLDPDKLKENWNKLGIKKPIYHEETQFDVLEASNPEFSFSMTEDGIILLKCPLGDVKKSVDKIEKYYSQLMGPSISYLFSLGAPIPKDLKVVQDSYPLYFVLEKATSSECLDLIKENGDSLQSSVRKNGVQIYNGQKTAVINIISSSQFSNIEECVRNIMLFREFERQSNMYLLSHRTIWDKTSEIRNYKKVNSKDFTKIRDILLEELKILSFGKARLAQMRDILEARENSIDQKTKRQLEILGLLERFEMLKSSQAYLSNLWMMTTDYVDGTQGLLETFYEESTKRELVLLNFLTVIAAAAQVISVGLVFMGITRYLLILGVIVCSILLYAVARYFVLNTGFSLNSQRQEKK